MNGLSSMTGHYSKANIHWQNTAASYYHMFYEHLLKEFNMRIMPEPKKTDTSF